MKEKPVRDQAIPLPEFRKLAREKLGARLAFHLNTAGGRGTTDHEWLAEHFDMISPRYYCMADPRVNAELKKSLLHLIHKYDAAMFSFDWIWWTKSMVCSALDHRGHLPGARYSREAITDSFIDLLKALRREQPDIMLTDLEVEHSPWWLLYAESLWSYAGEGRGLQAEVVDGSLARWQRVTAYPMKDVWHPVVLPIGCGVPHWKGEASLRELVEGALFQYLRGSQLQSFIFDVEHFSKSQAEAVPQLMKWANAREKIFLRNTKYSLGDPVKREAYALCNFSPDNRGVVGIYNPKPWKASSARLRLDEKMGFYKTAAAHVVRAVYPYQEVLSGSYRYGDVVRLQVPGQALLLLEVIPTALVRDTLIAGCRYVEERGQVVLVGRSGERKRLALVGGRTRKPLCLDGKRLSKGRPTALSLCGTPSRPFGLRNLRVAAAPRKDGRLSCKVEFDVDFSTREKVTLNMVSDIHMSTEVAEQVAGVETEKHLVTKLAAARAREESRSVADRQQFISDAKHRCSAAVRVNGKRRKATKREYADDVITHIGRHPDRRRSPFVRSWHKALIPQGRISMELTVSWQEANISVWLKREERLARCQKVQTSNSIRNIDDVDGELPYEFRTIREHTVTILDNRHVKKA